MAEEIKALEIKFRAKTFDGQWVYGTPIYEGDIIECKKFAKGKRRFLVYYEPCYDKFVARRIGDNYTASLFSFPKDYITVVGNRTDNPELLKLNEE